TSAGFAGHEERIQTCGRHRTAVAGIEREESLFLLGQPELPAEGRVGQGRLVDDGERLHEHSGALPEVAVLIDSEEARTEDRTERPIAEAKAPAALLLVQLRLRGAGEVVGQQVVVGLDGFLEHGEALIWLATLRRSVLLGTLLRSVAKRVSHQRQTSV